MIALRLILYKCIMYKMSLRISFPTLEDKTEMIIIKFCNRYYHCYIQLPYYLDKPILTSTSSQIPWRKIRNHYHLILISFLSIFRKRKLQLRKITREMVLSPANLLLVLTHELYPELGFANRPTKSAVQRLLLSSIRSFNSVETAWF